MDRDLLTVELGHASHQAHPSLCEGLEFGVRADGHGITQALGIQKIEELGRGKAGVRPAKQGDAGKGLTQQRQQAPQGRQDPEQRSRVAGSQDRGDRVLARLAIETDRDHQGQVAPRAIESVEEGQLLRSMSRIARRVEIDDDSARSPAAPPPRLLANNNFGQTQAQAQQFRSTDGVFETRQRRLRGQRLSPQRIAGAHQLQHRIVPQLRGVIAVRAAHGDAEDSLPQLIEPFMINLGSLARIVQHGPQRRSQPKLPVTGRQQDSAAVSAESVTGELRLHGLGK